MMNYLIKAQCSGYYASQIILDHQSELNVYVGKSQVTVKKQRLLTQCAEGMRQGDGKPGLADTALAGSNRKHILPLAETADRGSSGSNFEFFAIFHIFLFSASGQNQSGQGLRIDVCQPFGDGRADAGRAKS